MKAPRILEHSDYPWLMPIMIKLKDFSRIYDLNEEDRKALVETVKMCLLGADKEIVERDLKACRDFQDGRITRKELNEITEGGFE